MYLYFLYFRIAIPASTDRGGFLYCSLPRITFSREKLQIIEFNSIARKYCSNIEGKKKINQLLRNLMSKNGDKDG